MFTVLLPVKDQFGDALSWADLIVLAGTVSLEDAGAVPMRFCGGRTDAAGNDGGSDDLEPRVVGLANETAVILEDFADVMGLTRREFVALLGVSTHPSAVLEVSFSLDLRKIAVKVPLTSPALP